MHAWVRLVALVGLVLGLPWGASAQAGRVPRRLQAARLREIARILVLIGGGKYKEAVDKVRARFQEYIGLEFQEAFDLTALLIYWWLSRADGISRDANSATLIDNSTWLASTTIPKETFDRYLEQMASTVENIPDAFDKSGIKPGKDYFLETLPFGRGPLLRVTPDRTAILYPQLRGDKGGIDLFWLLTTNPGGPKETRSHFKTRLSANNAQAR